MNSFMNDVYFDPNYGKCNEFIESGKSEVFRFVGKCGEVSHMFILRPVENEKTTQKYYDIISPYGYGGPIIVNAQTGKEKELVSEFGVAFGQYCKERNIVSEFVRFHPVAGNGLVFKDIYNSEFVRHTVGTDLSRFDDPIASEFSKSCRKNIRKALNNGISYRITENPDNIDSFIKIYYSTMQRDKASEFYYFGKDYFDNLKKLLKKYLLYVEAIYNNETIAAGLYFKSNGIIHTHLSGTLSEYLYLSPAYVLRYAAAEWGKANGYSLIHHGGGKSNAPDDSLYLFKKQFGSNTTFDFYVGKKIWNSDAYNELCALSSVNADSEFFPAYRRRV